MFRGKMGLGGITWHVKTVESIEVYRVMYSMRRNGSGEGGGGGKKVNWLCNRGRDKTETSLVLS